MNHRATVAWAGALGASGVILGSFGAHALAARLAAAGMKGVWDTAVEFQLLHAAALLGLAAWLKAGGGGRWAGRLLCLGTVLFSGSLYCMALGGPRWVGPVTPLGGALLILGWIAAALAARLG